MMFSSDASGNRRLRVLFSMRNYWYVRHFEPVIRQLAADGHQVHLLAERAANERANDWHESAEVLAAEVPGLTFGTAPRADHDAWYDLRVILRLALDFIRFTTPEYAPLTLMVDRARQRTPRMLRALAESAAGRSAVGRGLIAGILSTAERLVPPDPALAAEIAARRPDVIAVTPLVELGSEQADVVRIARRLGIPTVLCTGSWDHLSSKGLIRAVPDRIVVWNETQKREATEMHGVPAERIEVTGAQCFDEWFDRKPTLDRDQFCRKVGLDSTTSFVLYVCSALFDGGPSESRFVCRWVEAARRDPALRATGILIRPHPKRASVFTDQDVTSGGSVTIWPPVAVAPLSAATKSDYFDSLYHASAIVGLNTSALIEAGIVGRPVLTILDPEFTGSQEGTLHFRYLLDGGLLRVARTLEEHLDQLAEAVAAPAGVRHNDAFVRAFVRPHGLHESATARVTHTIETLAFKPVAPVPDGMRALVGRALLRPIALLTDGRFAQQVARGRRRKIEDEVRAREYAIVVARRRRVFEDWRAAKETEKAARKAARAADVEQMRLAKAAAREAEAQQKRLAKEKALQLRTQAKAERLQRHREEKRDGVMKGSS